MRLLLDTHALIWWSSDLQNLRQEGLAAIASADRVFVSAVSAYELTLKYNLGKLPGVAALLPDLSDYLKSQDFSIMPISLDHAIRAGRLPLSHRDPFDRLLISQAITEDLILVSNEALFDQFGVQRLW